MRDVAIPESFMTSNKWKDLLHLTFEQCVHGGLATPTIPSSLDCRILWNHGNIKAGKDL